MFTDIKFLRNIFIGFFALLFLIICIFDFKLVVFAAAIILILCLPGYLFYKLIFPEKKLTFLESGALFFTLGVSLFLIPSILAYQLRLSWTVFSALWVFELIIIFFILRIKRIKLFRTVFLKMEHIDYLILFLFIMIASAMYLHGGHFIGDATFHLSNIMKLSENKFIDPLIPNAKIIRPTDINYGFNLFSVIFAFLDKVFLIELRKLWNLSPSLFSLFINSAIYFFSLRLFKKKIFVLISILSFFLYEYTLKWGDFKFLPYPDQIARNIFLFVSFGIIFFIKKDETERKKYLLLTSFLLFCMCFAHLYSFITYFYIFFIFTFLSILITRGSLERKSILKIGLIISLIGFALISLRLTLAGVFLSYFRVFWNNITENLTFILYLFIILIFLIPIYFFITKISQYDFINKKVFGINLNKLIYFFIFPLFIFIFIEFYTSINSLKYISSLIRENRPVYLRVNRPYDFILTDFGKYSILFFFSIIFISIILILLWKKKSLKQNESHVLLFMISCLTAVYLFKFKTISLFFIQVTKDTFVRRFFNYGLYSYLLIPIALFILYNAFPFEKIPTKKIFIIKKFAIVFVSVLIGAGLFDLFAHHTKNDKYNHDYIMRTENVYVILRKTTTKWSTIGSFAQSSQVLPSQIPCYSIFPEFKIRPPREYIFNYLIIHNKEDRSPPHPGSLVFYRKKVSLLPEIFKKMYQDDTYTLYQIDKSVEMKNLVAPTIQRINQLISEHNFERAYEQSFRLLILNKSEENFTLNEKTRNELYGINPEKTKLTPEFSFLNATTVPNLAGEQHNMNLLLDQEGYPSIQHRIYIAFKKLENNTEHSYLINFNCERNLHEFKFEWVKSRWRALAFSIDYFDGEKFETLVEKNDNDELINHIKLETPVKTNKIKITASRFVPALNEARLKNLEIR